MWCSLGLLSLPPSPSQFKSLVFPLGMHCTLGVAKHQASQTCSLCPIYSQIFSHLWNKLKFKPHCFLFVSNVTERNLLYFLLVFATQTFRDIRVIVELLSRFFFSMNFFNSFFFFNFFFCFILFLQLHILDIYYII